MTKPVANPMKTRPRSGNPNGNPKVSPEAVSAIRADPGTCRDVAAKYGISFGQVSRIRTGESWSKVK